MLKKTITFKDLDGNNLTEDFYFNLSKVEITEMEFDQQDGLVERLSSIVAAGEAKQILSTFKWILLKAYGVRSTDGKRFIKTPSLTEEFTQTDAYSVLFMELVTNAESSGAFIRGILPADLVKDMDTDDATLERLKTNIDRGIEDVQLPEPGSKLTLKPGEKHPADMTRDEMVEVLQQQKGPPKKHPSDMTREELIESLRKKSQEG